MGFTHLQIQRNPWIGGYRPQTPFSLPPVPNLICWTPLPEQNSVVRHCRTAPQRAAKLQSWWQSVNNDVCCTSFCKHFECTSLNVRQRPKLLEGERHKTGEHTHHVLPINVEDLRDPVQEVTWLSGLNCALCMSLWTWQHVRLPNRLPKHADYNTQNSNFALAFHPQRRTWTEDAR
jgi:hypothetical protein